MRGANLWKTALIAQFMGYFPNFSYFQKMAKVLWGNEVVVNPTKDGLFIVQFPDLESRDKVLKGGPWHIHGQSVILRKWERGFSKFEFDMIRMPIWVPLSNVPLELFTQEGLGYIASAIGNPLYMDRVTANKRKACLCKGVRRGRGGEGHSSCD